MTLCLYFQEKASNLSSGFVVTDFVMPARDKPISHPPADPPLCENVSLSNNYEKHLKQKLT